MAIVTMDGLIAAIAGSSRRLPFSKASMTSKAAGSFQSLWTANGLPGAGAAHGSTTGAECNDATTGAWPITDPSGSNLLYLVKAALTSSTPGTLILYDRLWHNSGMDGTSTSAQPCACTVSGLSRYTDGLGLEAMIEIFTATGSTARNATLAYTNTAAASKTAVVSLIASPVAGQILPFPLAAGDIGIATTTSITLAASTGTAGNFGLTLAKRIATIPLTNPMVALDAIALAMPQIPSNACLFGVVACTTTNTGNIGGELVIAEG